MEDLLALDLGQPVCICGRPMRLKMIAPVPAKSNKIDRSEIHTFECGPCGHELKVIHDVQP